MTIADAETLEQRFARLERLITDTLRRLTVSHAPDRLLSVEEAGALLDMSRSAVYNLINDGKIGVVEDYGKHIPLSAAMEYIKRNTKPVVSYGAACKR